MVIGRHYRGLELSIVAAREKEGNPLTNEKTYTERSASQEVEVTKANHSCICHVEIKANLPKSLAEPDSKRFSWCFLDTNFSGEI